MRASASRFESGVSAVAYAIQSASARVPMIGFSFLQISLSSWSHIFEKDGSSPGLFVSFPSGEKVTHDGGHIAPALNFLGSALTIKLEELPIEHSLFLVVTQMVTSSLIKFDEHSTQERFVVLDTGQVVAGNA